jgi:uncharacterized membrane protein YphA (DoxX/SURF4 family)
MLNAPIKDITLPDAQGEERLPVLDMDLQPDGLRAKALGFATEMRKQANHLSPAMQLLFLAGVMFLSVSVPVILLFGMLAPPVSIHHTAYVTGGAVLIVATMALVYVLARRSEKKRASESFGEMVDRKPRL